MWAQMPVKVCARNIRCYYESISDPVMQEYKVKWNGYEWKKLL